MTTSGPTELEASPGRVLHGVLQGVLQGVHRLARHLVLGAAVLGVAGCQRRAPGPDECHELAVKWILAEHSGYRLGSRAIVVPESAVMERTTECLTTPYDRELVQCVTAGAPPRSCLRAFQARRRPAAALPEP